MQTQNSKLKYSKALTLKNVDTNLNSQTKFHSDFSLENVPEKSWSHEPESTYRKVRIHYLNGLTFRTG